jgi:hypothetical protein
VAASAAGEGDHEAQPRHHQRWVRRRQDLPNSSRELPLPPARGGSNLILPSDSVVGARSPEDLNPELPKLRRYIDRSAKIARAEDELSKALYVSIVGNSAAPLVDTLMAELARHYELPVESLQVHHLSFGDYLLVLSYKVAAIRFYNDGRPL